MLSYQAKTRLRKILIGLLMLALVLLVVWICWMVWLQRYIVFTRDGVVFAFDRSTLLLEEKAESQVTQPERITMELEIADETVPVQSQTLSGVYVDTELLTGQLEQVPAELAALEPGTAVMLDVKSIFGNYYYSTQMTGGEQSTAVDISAMDGLISTLAQGEAYLIARVPAFRDSAFALDNPSCGLALASGALWTDEESCYWLDPANQMVVDHLIQLCRELQGLGFDEVVFTDFRIPDSETIAYSASASKAQILQDAAQQLVTACAGDTFAVSFTGTAAFTLPQGRTRLYLEGVLPEQLEATVDAVTVAEPTWQLVFLTDTRDTRFDAYSVLRRLNG